MRHTTAPAPEGLQSLSTLPRARIVVTVIGVLLGLLLAALDQTIVATALPRIVSDLGGFDRFAWVFTAYMLASTAGLPIAGKLSDIYGRKPLYLAGIAIFILGSILSGTSQSMTQLILFRGLQGLGAAVIMANAFAVVGDIFPPAERGKWMGIFGAVFGIASIVGPLTGGYITDNLSWRWVFYVNLPVGLAASLVLLIAMPHLRDQSVKRKIDFTGAAVLVAAVVGLLLAFTWAGNTYPWVSPQVTGMMAFSAAMFLLFWVVEKRAAEPVLPPNLFASRIFNVAMGVTFLTGIAMFGTIIFLPLFIQAVIGASATGSGAVLTPMMFSVVAGSAISGQIISRTGHYRFLGVAGMALMVLGLFLFSRMDADTSYGTVVRNMVVMGVGLGATFPTYVISVQNAFPHRMLGIVTSTVQFFRMTGGTFGAAIMGSLLASRMAAHLARAVAQAQQSGALPPQMAAMMSDSALPSQGLDALNGFSSGGMSGLPEAMMGPVRTALATALQDVFLLAVAFAAVAAVVGVFMREIPLRRSNIPPE
jgi:EmrB/QacA subfamily drug resistance transporter